MERTEMLSFIISSILLLSFLVVSATAFLPPKPAISGTTTRLQQNKPATIDNDDSDADIVNKNDNNSRRSNQQGPLLQVAFLLPSNPENPILQDSANQIVTKLLQLERQCCEACGVVCNTQQADIVCQQANVLIALGAQSPMDVRFVATAFRLRRAASAAPAPAPATPRSICQLALGGKPFAPLLDCYDEANPPPNWQQNLLPWTTAAKDRKLLQDMQILFDKDEIDDYVRAIELYLMAKG